MDHGFIERHALSEVMRGVLRFGGEWGTICSYPCDPEWVSKDTELVEPSIFDTLVC